MKSLREMLNSDQRNKDTKSKAFLTRQKLENGKYILLPGYEVDYMEQNAAEDIVFRHELYTQGQAGFNSRNVKAKRKFDVDHKVSQSDLKNKRDVIDQT